MPSLTRSEPLDPFEIESSASVFRRLLLRLAVLAGLASSMLVWRIAPILLVVGFVVAFSMLTAAASLRHQRWPHALTAGLFTTRVCFRLVAAVAVIDLAGLAGVLLVATCVVLSDEARAGIVLGTRRALQRMQRARVRR